jgi:hypothetical protein
LKKNQDNCVSEAHDRICLAGAMVLGGRRSQYKAKQPECGWLARSERAPGSRYR